ncbi:MAG TPA: type III PLP-dependent enzyme [Candidatus Eisenbacteria bacterium]|nr:type III PLP-dependent enzyme [Candidatus Eisenbacteria bacterium]
MDHVRELVARHFGARDGELRIGGLSVRDLAATYGTPLFVYDADVLDKQIALLRATYPPIFEIYYSVKANPCPAVVRHFVSRGLGLEIASAGEFHQARHAGCEPERILFAGPGKTERELAYVLERGIGEIHLESKVEAARVAAISKRLGVRTSVAIRVNPGAEAQGGAMRMGGKPAPFGVDEEALDEVLDLVLAESSLDLHGIHLYAGTQILDDRILVTQYRRGLDIARRAADRMGRPIRTLDFGGGLGIPYFPNESPLPAAALAEGLAAMVKEIESDPRFARARFIIEPGRFLVGEAGVYVTRVNDIKVSRGKTFLVVDGGMNHHLAASGNLGQVIKRNFPAAILNRLDAAPAGKADVVGPLCTPLDVIARDIELPAAEVGDLFGVFQSGAYARSASPLGFLSQPTPAEIVVQGGAATLARRAGTYEETLGDVP